MKVLALGLSIVAASYAGEYAVLQNGFKIYAQRHETVEAYTRLHTNDGSVDVPSSDILGFEVEEYTKPPEPPAAKTPEVGSTVPLIQASPQELINAAASRNGLLPEFVRSVAAAESAFSARAISPKGAIGLMQLMPDTAKELGANPHDPAENADAGARYLKQLLIKYQNSRDPVRLALAAYNAGPGAVDRYGRIPPYRETQQYVERVLRKYLAELKAKKS